MWTNPDEVYYVDHGEIENGGEVLLHRLERIRRMLWLGVPSVIVEDEIKRLADEHEKFSLSRRGPLH